MPVEYQIENPPGLIRTRCIGNVSLEEVVNHFAILAQDSHRPPKLDVLLDLTKMQSIPFSWELRTVSKAIRDVRDKVQFGALAIVTSTELVYGLSRMFAVFIQDDFQTVDVFREMDNAELWLASQRSLRQ